MSLVTDWIREADALATDLESKGKNVEATMALQKCFARILDQEETFSAPAFVAMCERLGIKYNTQGVRCFKNGDYDTATADFERALRVSEHLAMKSSDVSRRLEATTQNNLGCMERSRGNLEQALFHLQRSSETEENQSVASAMNMSAILTQLQRHDEAVVCARRAIVLLEASPAQQLNENLFIVAHHNLAIALETVGGASDEITENYESAYEHAERIIGPQHPTTLSIKRNYNRWKQSCTRNRSMPHHASSTLPNIRSSSNANRTKQTNPRGGGFAVGPGSASMSSPAQHHAADQPAPPPPSHVSDRLAARRESRRQSVEKASVDISDQQQAAPVKPTPPPTQLSKGPRRPSLTRETLELNQRQLEVDGTSPSVSPPQQQPKRELKLHQNVKKADPSAEVARGPIPVSTPRESVSQKSMRPAPPKDMRRQDASGEPARGRRGSEAANLQPPSQTNRKPSMLTNQRAALSPHQNALPRNSQDVEEDERSKENAVAYMFNRLAVLLRAEEEWEARYLNVTTIQRAYRCYRDKTKLQKLRESRRKAIRKQLQKENAAAKVVSRACREVVRMKKNERLEEEARQQEQRRRHVAAIRIESVARRWLAKRHVRRIREYYQAFNRSLLRLQCWFRQVLAKKNTAMLRASVQNAARAQKLELLRVRAAIDIQRIWRARLASRRTDAARGKMRKARELNWQRLRVFSATKLQAVWHGFLSRRSTKLVCAQRLDMLARRERTQLLYDSALRIQIAWKRAQAEKRAARLNVNKVWSQQQNMATTQSRAATVMQCAWRSAIARSRSNKLRSSRNNLHKNSKSDFASARIAAVWKGFKLRRSRDSRASTKRLEAATLNQQLSDDYSRVLELARSRNAVDLQSYIITPEQHKEKVTTGVQALLRAQFSCVRIRRKCADLVWRVNDQHRRRMALPVLQRALRGLLCRQNVGVMYHNHILRHVLEIQRRGWGLLVRLAVAERQRNRAMNLSVAAQPVGRGFIARKELKWMSTLKSPQKHPEAESPVDEDISQEEAIDAGDADGLSETVPFQVTTFSSIPMAELLSPTTDDDAVVLMESEVPTVDVASPMQATASAGLLVRHGSVSGGSHTTRMRASVQEQDMPDRPGRPSPMSSLVSSPVAPFSTSPTAEEIDNKAKEQAAERHSFCDDESAVRCRLETDYDSGVDAIQTYILDARQAEEDLIQLRIEQQRAKEEFERMRDAAAKELIASVVSGHKDRLLVVAPSYFSHRKQTRQNAATRIQTQARGMAGRRVAAEKRMIAEARLKEEIEETAVQKNSGVLARFCRQMPCRSSSHKTK
eukprot:PhM_4_TR16252/c0_g2_i1/m.87141